MALSLKRASSSLPFSSTPRPLKKYRKDSIIKNDSFASGLLLDSSNSHCISSSEDDSEVEEFYDQSLSSRRKSSIRRRSSTKSAADTPLNIELSRAVALYSDDEEDNDNDQRKCLSKHSKTSRGRKSPVPESKENLSLSSTGANKSSRSFPDSDRVARARCLDYLVSAIDEAWARYCDATSYAEDERYNYPSTPASIGISDNDENSDASLAETEITDYADSDFNAVDSKSVNKNKKEQAKHQTSLQHLKDRLTNAKYFLQDYVDSDDYDDCVAFWKRWDMVKYCTIELVEDEDEDDVVESTIEELEEGRCQSTV